MDPEAIGRAEIDSELIEINSATVFGQRCFPAFQDSRIPAPRSPSFYAFQLNRPYAFPYRFSPPSTYRASTGLSSLYENRKSNVERPTSNIERPMWMTLRFIDLY